jgi:hypothetical protein
MSTIEKRLDALEAKITPSSKRPFAVVYFDDGVYYDGSPTGPNPGKPLTDEQMDELRANTEALFVVRYDDRIGLEAGNGDN